MKSDWRLSGWKKKNNVPAFSLLRAGLENGEYQILAQAMDARWYLDTEPAEVGFSLDFLFPMGGYPQRVDGKQPEIPG